MSATEAIAKAFAELTPVAGARLAKCQDTSVEFDTNAGKLRISSWSSDIMRIQLGKQQGADYGLVTGRPQAHKLANVSEQDGIFSAQLGAFTIACKLTEGTVSISDDSEQLLAAPTDAHFTRKFRLPQFSFDASGNHGCAFDLTDNERIYGLGEKWSGLDLRGQLIHSYNHDSLGSNAEHSYKNSTFIWSSRGWGMLFNTPAPVMHAVGYAPVAHRTYAACIEDSLDVFVIRADRATDMLAAFHSLCGLPGKLPAWSFGPWISKAYYRTADELLETAKEVRRRKLPCDVIVLDGRAWQNTAERFSFDWDASRYPNPEQTLEQLHSLDFKVCAWIYPLCSIANPKYQQLDKTGIFLKDNQGQTLTYRFEREPFGKVLTPLPDSAIVDFTNGEARQWWQNGCRSLIKQGIDAFKTDFGEQVPDDAVANNGDSGRRLHNVYSLLYNRTTHESFAQTNKPAVLWTRSGWVGSHRYPLHWVGDTQSDWGGLRTALRGELSWMLSGGAYSSSDIGGFYGEQPTAALYIRWLQHGVLSSHMRMHGIGAREPWKFGKRALRIAEQWLNLRAQLRPYLLRTAKQAEQGLPMMRPMQLTYESQVPHNRSCDLQYMLGDDIFCALATEDKQIAFWLPPGRWFDFFRNRFCRGNRWIKRACPLAEAPLFMRSGNIIEMTDPQGDGQTSTLLVCGLPKPGELSCGLHASEHKDGILLDAPKQLKLDCQGCVAEQDEQNRWLLKPPAT